MRQKYKISSCPAEWNGPQRCSPEWKQLLSIKQDFSARCSWTIGSGNISFWYDKWHPEFLLDLLSPNEDIRLKLRDLCENNIWHLDHLAPALGNNVVQALYDHAPRLTEDDDIRHWAAEPTGIFTTKSAWNSIRVHHPTIHILGDIWATPMPLSAKLTCWRIFHNILPVDQRAQCTGISIASKCVCCQNPQIESLDHLFVHSELASSLWKYFGALFAVPFFPAQPIITRIKWWFRTCKGSSHFSILGRLACIAICRQIWSFRNNSIYGGMKKDFNHARMVVIDTLQHVDLLIKPLQPSSKYGVDSLLAIGITPKAPKPRKISWCSWTPPRETSFALHTDASCRNSSMAIGGVIRDHKGDLFCAFAGPKGAGTSLQGETLALAEGAALIDDLSLNHVCAYTDSMILAKSIGRRSPHWKLTKNWKEMHDIIRDVPVHYCTRESNAVADALSKLGHSLPYLQYFFDPSALPRYIQHLLWQDRMGFQYLRCR